MKSTADRETGIQTENVWKSADVSTKTGQLWHEGYYFEGYNHIVVTVLEGVISLGYIVMYLQKKSEESKDSFQNNHKLEK